MDLQEIENKDKKKKKLQKNKGIQHSTISYLCVTFNLFFRKPFLESYNGTSYANHTSFVEANTTIKL